MKKILFIVALTVLSISSYAQTDLSSMVSFGYQTGTNRFGVGIEGRYAIPYNIRVAPQLVFFIPKNDIAGLDINLDVHYLFHLTPISNIYPLIGFAIDNNHYSPPGQPSFGETHLGFNLGGGADYNLNKKNYLNAEFRYTLNKYNYGFFSVGYGFRF